MVLVKLIDVGRVELMDEEEGEGGEGVGVRVGVGAGERGGTTEGASNEVDGKPGEEMRPVRTSENMERLDVI
jgi:hypothetical protein